VAFAFEKLNVCQKALDFADRICGITSSFTKAYYFFAEQFKRALPPILPKATADLPKMTENITSASLAAQSRSECLRLNWLSDKSI